MLFAGALLQRVPFPAGVMDAHRYTRSLTSVRTRAALAIPWFLRWHEHPFRGAWPLALVVTRLCHKEARRVVGSMLGAVMRRTPCGAREGGRLNGKRAWALCKKNTLRPKEEEDVLL